MRTSIVSLAAAALASSVLSAPASAQMIGQIKAFGFDFCPQGWVSASGELLPISQYEALFSLYGTTYGGDGNSTFAVPNLNGRFAIGQGTGPNGRAWVQGQQAGQADVVLTLSQLATHTHSFGASTQPAAERDPTGRALGSFNAVDAYAPPGSSDVLMAQDSVGRAGGDQPISVRDPYLALNYCVAYDGIYPTRP